MAVTGSITLAASARQTATPDLGDAAANLAVKLAVSLANGTGAAQFDKVWGDERTLAASATEDLDLAGTALLDTYGTAVAFTKVTLLAVIADPGNTNNVVVGAAAANAWTGMLNSTGTITLRPGGFAFIGVGAADLSGHTVTAGTGDLLKVANSGGTTGVTYKILVFGKSA